MPRIWKSEYDDNRKSKLQLSVRLKEDEAMWLFGEATNAGLSISQYVRNKVFKELYETNGKDDEQR